jgi:hypothetical protein
MTLNAATQIDLLSDRFIKDPYVCYQTLRQSSPVVATKQNGVLLTRHQDIAHALKSDNLTSPISKLSKHHSNIQDANQPPYPNILPFQRGMPHRQNRALIQSIFRSVGDDASHMINDAAQKVLQHHADTDEVNVIQDLGEPYALDCMCKLIGLPEIDVDQLSAWTKNFFTLFEPNASQSQLQQTNRQLTDFRDYLREITQSQAFKSRYTIFRHYFEQAIEKKYDTETVIDNVILLFANGIENIQYAIANVLIQVQYADTNLKSLLNTDPKLFHTVQESLRLDAPAQILHRQVKNNFIIHRTELEPDTSVFLAIGSANRDENVFAKPNQFDLQRNFSNVFTFGSGKHACIGKNVTSNLLQIFLQQLAQFHYVIKSDLEQLNYIARFGHRWPQKLQISYG